MNKYIKKTLMSVMLGSMSFLLFSCGGLLQIGTPTPSEEIKESTSETIKPGTSEEGTQILSQQEKIYQLAKASGYQGTYEQWLESIKGDQVVIAVVNNALQWRYASDSNWTVLIDLSDLKGEDGHTPYIGKNGNWWINGADTGVYAGGKDGENGLTPHIGWNGNWWIGEEDTGVYAGGQGGSTPIETHTVTFHFENGRTKEVEVPWGYTVEDVGYEEVIGKEFLGWYYQGTDKEWMFDFYPVTKDIHLYACYEEIKYAMHLEGYGQYDIWYGQYYDLPELSKKGYNFLGWEYNGQIFDVGYFEYTYDIYLKPAWEKIPDIFYNVSLEHMATDGTLLYSAEGTFKTDTICPLKAPLEYNDGLYVFDYWLVEGYDDYGNTYLLDTIETINLDYYVQQDLKLTVIYELNEFANLDEAYNQVYGMAIDKTNIDCGGDNLTVITDPTAVFHENGDWTNGLFNTSWRLIVAVDNEGKIAYLVQNPAMGYGGPSGTGYYAHPDYYDYTTNPALNILEGYGPWTPENPSTSSKFEIKVPEGGFIIVSHGTASNDLLNAIKNDFVDVNNDGNVNNRESINKDIRILFGQKSNYLVAYKNELDENALVNAIINEKSDNYPTIYTSESSDVVLGDFSVAVDSDGKIIFISKTADGYGGPADGFYHDGSYQLEPGKQCGIFNLYNDFAGWPNVTPDGKNAWTQYEVVVPEGCYVITGNWAQMSNFLTSIDEKAYEHSNYFEGVADGIYNDTHCLIVNIANNVGNIYLNKSEINVSNLVYTGTNYGDFTYNEATGLYEATVNLNTWNNIVFTYTDKSGNQITLNHDNSNLVGYFTESSFFGCDWTENLYRESYDGKFYTCTGGLYSFTFDPNTMTLTASIVNNLNVIQSNVTIDRTNQIGWSDASYWSDIASAAGDVDFTIEYQLYGGTELWQTSLFVIHYGNGGMNVAVSRADNWGWVDSANGENQLGNFTAGSMSGNLSTETYKDCNVTLNVKRQGSFIFLTYNVQATNGNSITFTQEYAGVTAEELIFSFTAEYAKIVVNNVY